MKTVSKKLGNRRLRELAKILKAAHRRYLRNGKQARGEGYDQMRYTHPCGTPACAAGHWAAAHPRRWSPEYAALRPSKGGTGWGPPDRCQEFALSNDEESKLFGQFGCGEATTALKAANYILAFVERREKRANDARGAVA